jgi:membrane protein DedA with SNARE-associated domain
MTETLISVLADYGIALLFFTTFFSCLALPMPSSLLMLAAGAFVATGDLDGITTVLAALSGALCGDQVGYLMGARGRGKVTRFMARTDARSRMMARSEAYLNQWGGLGVFLSRWLFSPLGPYINFVSGAGQLPLWQFTLSAALGECIWVGLYVGLGFGFADNLTMASELAGDMLGLLAGISLVLGFGFWLIQHDRKKQAAAEAN